MGCWWAAFAVASFCAVACRSASHSGPTEHVEDSVPCDSQVFCTGMILDTVQRLKIYNDSKTFVDLPLLKSPQALTVQIFQDLADSAGGASNLTVAQVKEFLAQNFETVNPFLPEFCLPDWQNATSGFGGLPILQNITDPQLRDFAIVIHDTWRKLGRNIPDDVREFPERHSLIYLPNPFIVPGGRFGEIYYWDSFWVVQGLLVSNMSETARGMIKNFAHLIKTYGHVLNGNRVYYEKRSQPPLLAMIVNEYRNHKNVPPKDRKSIIAEILPALEEEHQFWMRERAITVHIGRRLYNLNVYKGGITRPRPESYREDMLAAEELQPSQQSDKQLWANIAAAAESGWDFSTRWLNNPQSNFTSIRTETIVPVDLNAILCAQERLMSQFYNLTGDQAKAKFYEELALDRGDAIHAVLWNEKESMWRDYDSSNHRQRDHFFLSAIAPLFTRCSGHRVNIMSPDFLTKVIASSDIQKAASYIGGFPATFDPSPAGGCCQWDFPNAWPPLVMMLIEAFAGTAEVRSTAVEWAQKWISAVYTGYGQHGYFFEKYDSRDIGAYGSGGEYSVQLGFGWTNGGILRLLELFPTELTAPSNASWVTTPPSNGAAVPPRTPDTLIQVMVVATFSGLSVLSVIVFYIIGVTT